MNESIEIGDIVKFDDDFGRRNNGKIVRVIDVKKSRQCKSGIGIRVEGRKTYYDSEWFTIIQKFMPLNFDL